MIQTYVKSLIIQLREDGKSFQEISDILANEYDIVKSRQAIHGIYTRAIQNGSQVQQESVDIHDILTYVSLGLPIQQVSSLTDTTVYKVKQIINENEEELKKIKIEQFKKSVKYFADGESLKKISDKLQYKGIKPTKYMLRKLFEDYVNYAIAESTIATLTTILNNYPDTVTKEVIKSTLKNKQQIKRVYRGAK